MKDVADRTAIKRDRYRVSMAATFAVASELSRRGYNVGLTVGNTPKVDLICSVPRGKAFKLQVKGTSGKTGVFIQTSFLSRPADDDLYLIVVLVPSSLESYGPSFFILTHAQAIKESEEHATRMDGTPFSPKSADGLYWKHIEPYKDKWDALPATP